MKKYLIVILLLCLTIGLNSCSSNDKDLINCEINITNSKKSSTKTVYCNNSVLRYVIIELTYAGKTHQFVSGYQRLAHWPDCKYCNDKK